MISTSVLLSAAFAGLVAIAVAAAVERWGGRVGGLLGTLPTTIVPASLGIIAQDAAMDMDAYGQAMGAVPLGMLINAVFLGMWRVLPPRLPAASSNIRLVWMVVLTLGGWGVLAAASAALLARLRSAGADMVVLGLGIWAGTVLLGIWACWRVHPAPAGRRSVGPLAVVLRGSVAALAIGVAVQIAREGHGLIAGMAAVFPAIFLTTMVSLWLAQGESVQAGAVGPMMLGSAAVSAYALLSVGSMARWGPAGGAVAAWVGAVLLVTLPAYLWLSRNRR